MTLHRPLVSHPSDSGNEEAVTAESNIPRLSRRQQAAVTMQAQRENSLLKDPLAEIRLAIEEALAARRVTILGEDDNGITPMELVESKNPQDRHAKDKLESVE